MNVKIDTAIKRARGYWFVDGFTEIALGGLLILLGGFLLINIKTSQAAFPSWFLSVTREITLLKITSFVVVVLILWWLKDHFTYPRTGFMRGKIRMTQILVIVKNMIFFLLLPGVGLLIASLLVTSTGSVLSSMPVWLPIGLGLIWAILIVLAGGWMGLPRFHLIGGMLLLAGIGVGIWQLTMGLPNVPANVQPELLQLPVLESISRTLTSLGMTLLITGLILTCSGLLTFIRYQRENPPPSAEAV